MSRRGWWPTWWTSILLSVAYRRIEASDEVGGRARGQGGGLYNNSTIHWRTVAVTEDQTNDDQTVQSILWSDSQGKIVAYNPTSVMENCFASVVSYLFFLPSR